MHFKLLYLILQKALGKSRESHLNTRCRRPANRITELCAPITGTHPQSRDPFTPADPVLLTHTRRPQFRAPRRHPQSRIHVPAVTGPRQHLQTQRPPPVVVGQPLREETREAPGREGCKRTGHPPLHDCLGAPAQCPHPAAGGRHPGAEDRVRLALLWVGGVGGHWPLGRRGCAVRVWG